jgi:hypothetical protein
VNSSRLIPGSRDLVSGDFHIQPTTPRNGSEARTPRGSGFRVFRHLPALDSFHSTPPRLPYGTFLHMPNDLLYLRLLCLPLIFSNIQPHTNHSAGLQISRCITNLSGFSLGVATLAQCCASALQKICKCLVDTFGDICSRALRARMTGRALFKACLSNYCMQPPMSPWLRPWTDPTRSWRKPCAAMPCVLGVLARPLCTFGVSKRPNDANANASRCAGGSTSSVNGHLLVGGWPRQSFAR